MTVGNLITRRDKLNCVSTIKKLLELGIPTLEKLRQKGHWECCVLQQDRCVLETSVIPALRKDRVKKITGDY